VFGFGEGLEGNLSLPTVAASALTPMQQYELDCRDIT